MKRKRLAIFIYTTLLLAGLCVLFQLTRMLACFSVTSNNLQPQYRAGSFILASGLKPYTYNDLVCFKNSTPLKSDASIQILRIAGMPGDTIEMKDGYIIRNGYFADHAEKLIFRYDAKRKLIKDSLFFGSLTIHPKTTKDSIQFYLTAKEYSHESRNYLLHKVNVAPIKVVKDGKLWSLAMNNNNSFRYVIPPGHVFLLGDNRDQAIDSRTFGYISVKDILATLLLQH